MMIDSKKIKNYVRRSFELATQAKENMGECGYERGLSFQRGRQHAFKEIIKFIERLEEEDGQ